MDQKLNDPEKAVLFTTLSKIGFSFRFLCQHVYGMTEAEAEQTWQLKLDETIDMHERNIELRFRQRESLKGGK